MKTNKINKELYEEILREINEDNVDFACISANTKQELAEEIIAYLEEETYYFENKYDESFGEMDKETAKEVIENIESRIVWIGEGVYDIWGREFRSDWSIAEINNIAESELDAIGVDIKIYTDPEGYIKDCKEEEDCKYMYAVFGVSSGWNIRNDLQYIVKSDVELNIYDVYNVLEENGVEPNCFGLPHGPNQWGNYNIIELEDMTTYGLFDFSEDYGCVETFDYESELEKNRENEDGNELEI